MVKPHDMGGIKSEDSIPNTDQTRIFEREWHKKALALTLAAGGLGYWNLDRSRLFREALPEQDYRRLTYYEKWLAALTNLLVDSNLLNERDFDTGFHEIKPGHCPCVSPETMAHMIRVGASTEMTGMDVASRFSLEQRVRTIDEPQNRFVPDGHTRLPSYASGRVGIIRANHGFHIFPDCHAHGLGPNPEPLYNVEFLAGELWGPETDHPDDKISLDLWQSYLKPA